MRFTLYAALIAAALFAPQLASLEARADDVPARVARKERSTLPKVASELLKLSKYCAQKKAYEEARAEARKGLAILPDDKKLTAQLSKLGGKEGAPKGSFARAYEDRQKKAYQKCGKLLGDLIRLCDKEDASERFEHYVGMVQTHFPGSDALADSGLVYFEPYLKWVRDTDAKRLAQGGEWIDGGWLEQSEVEALERKHADWQNPWVLTDGLHEVRTTMSYRTARELLAHVTAYRTFFLQRFGGAWDLKRPEGKLPVIVTATQQELRERMEAEMPGAGARGSSFHGAAFYMQTNGSLNPCFVTYEPTDATGRVVKATREVVLLALKHEVTHQIAFEYSKHDFDNTRQVTHQFWSVEAIANFMQYHVYERGVWRLTHPRTIPMGGGYIEGAFAHCVANVRSLPSLQSFFSLGQQQFMTVENYHVAATVAYFLLHGEDGRYRTSFIRLLETVHKVRDDAGTFERCFNGVDMKTLQKEWLRFVNQIKLDPSTGSG